MRLNADLRAADQRIQFEKFAAVMCCWARAKGDGATAAEMAKARGVGRDVEMVLRAAVGAQLATSDIADFRPMAEGLVAAQFNVLAEKVLAAVSPAQPHSALRLISQVGTGTQGAEGKARPATQMTSNRVTLDEHIASVLLVASDDAFRFGDPALIQRAAVTACGAAIDQIFCTELLNIATPVAATGIDPGGIMLDLRRGLDLLPIGPTSDLYLGVSTAALKRMCCATTATGAIAFPNLTAQGGRIGPFNVSATDALGNDALLIDATAFAGQGLGVELGIATAGAIELEDEPTNASDTPVETTMVSLFQTNSRAIKIERRFCFERIRAPGVVKLTGILWALDPNTSPPT